MKGKLRQTGFIFGSMGIALLLVAAYVALTASSYATSVPGLKLVGFVLAQPAPTVGLPGAGNRTFPETGKTVRGLFLDYWDKNGGLAQQGFPISELMAEVSDLDGKAYTVQYFERAVFEYHPEQQAPFNVLLSQLGTFQYRKTYPNGAPGQQANNTVGSQLFPETGKRVGGAFLDYWKKNGGLAQQGFPISDEFDEVSDLDGKSYRVQYFERAVFELHLENEPPYDVLLSQLGTFRYREKYEGTTGDGTPTRIPVATATTAAGSSPGKREAHALVYHNQLKMVLLLNSGDLAGEAGSTPGKVWGWDGTNWKVVSPGGPDVRTLGGVAYDSGRNRVVTFGGWYLSSRSGRYYGDTWEWDGANWQHKEGAGPGIRHHVQTAYDASRKQSVLYGGFTETSQGSNSTRTETQDTWAWDGIGWKQVSTQGKPGPRQHHSMIYHPVRQKVLLFGGISSTGLHNTLWEWDGSDWQQINTSGSAPSPRLGARMSYDAKSGNVVLFGGRTADAFYDDTWTWDGTNWTQVSVSGAHPAARASYDMAYDTNRGRVVLYGGSNDSTTFEDTWEWDGTSWVQVGLR
ncbi:MAG TPA: kelch repeat-containing protein [Chloroflexia bacterium]|nr:kelch repeat-containing protein [Chloroflexia bacterium]